MKTGGEALKSDGNIAALITKGAFLEYWQAQLNPQSPPTAVRGYLLNLGLDYIYSEQLSIVVNYAWEKRETENRAWSQTDYLADYAFGWVPRDYTVSMITAGFKGYF